MKNKWFLKVGFSVFLGCFLSACVAHRPHFPKETPYFNWIQDTADDDFSLTGRIYLWQTPSLEGVRIQLIMTGGLANETYYAQIHSKGNCQDPGAVYTPKRSFWPLKKHLGYLGSFKNATDQRAEFDIYTTKLSFGGSKNNIAGRSFVISEDKKAKLKVGCAVIPVPKKPEESID